MTFYTSAKYLKKLNVLVPYPQASFSAIYTIEIFTLTTFLPVLKNIYTQLFCFFFFFRKKYLKNRTKLRTMDGYPI